MPQHFRELYDHDPLKHKSTTVTTYLVIELSDGQQSVKATHYRKRDAEWNAKGLRAQWGSMMGDLVIVRVRESIATSVTATYPVVAPGDTDGAK